MRKWLIAALCLSPSLALAGINVTPGSGKTVHTDTVGGEEYQAVKIIDGTTGGTSSATVTSNGQLVVQVQASTAGVTQIGSWNLTNSTVGVVGTVGATQSGNWNLTNSTVGVVGTVAATQSGNWNLTNSTVGIAGIVPVSQSGNWNLANSTVGVVGTIAATQSGNWNLANSTVGVVQVGNWNLTNSTVGVVGTVSVNTHAVTLNQAANNIGNVNVITTNTIPVSLIAGQSLTNSTFTIVTSTITVDKIQNALPQGGNSLGNVNITSTNTLTVSGSLTANSVNITTATFNGAIPQALSIVGGINTNGNGQSFAVTADSAVVVQAIKSTVTIQNIQQALPQGGNSLGNVNITSTNTLAVSGSLTANSVNITTSSFNGAMPLALGIVGGVNPFGNAQSFGVDNSSNAKVYVTNLSTIQVVATTITIQNIQQALPAGGNSLGNVNIVSSGAISVSGSSVTVNIQPGQNVTLFGSTSAVSAIQSALPSGGNSLGNVNAISTSAVLMSIIDVTGSTRTLGYQGGQSSAPVNVLNTVTVQSPNNNTTAIPITGSISANSVNVSTALINGAMIGTGTVVVGVGWTGLPQTFQVNPSSAMMVYVTNLSTQSIVASTMTIQNIQQALPAGGNSLGNININSTGTLSVQGVLSDNAALVSTNTVGVLPAVITSSRPTNLNGTALTSGRNAFLRVGNDGTGQNAWLPSTAMYSYRASTNTITLPAGTSDFVSLAGNYGVYTWVTKIKASCTQTTAGTVNLTLKKYSGGNYKGAWSTATAVVDFSSYTVVQSSMIWFENTWPSSTSGPTLVGDIDNVKLGCNATGTASPNDIYIWNGQQKPVVLQGKGDFLSLNLENQTATGGKFTATYEWIEIPSP